MLAQKSLIKISSSGFSEFALVSLNFQVILLFSLLLVLFFPYPNNPKPLFQSYLFPQMIE